MVGTPNVGKSLLFHSLTGAYAAVSNYPGTTVDIRHATTRLNQRTFEVFDLPGIYSLLPLTEEERVTRRMLLTSFGSVIVQVADAKNLERALLLTYELMDAGLPLILVVNMMDEAQKLGIAYQRAKLTEQLHIPVLTMSALYSPDISKLKCLIAGYRPQSVEALTGSEALESLLTQMMAEVPKELPINRRIAAYLLLQQDRELIHWLEERRIAALAVAKAEELSKQWEKEQGVTFGKAWLTERRNQARRVVHDSGTFQKAALRATMAVRFGRISLKFVPGLIIGFVILYFVLYWGVGRLGAGVLVDILNQEFERVIIPECRELLVQASGPLWLMELLLGEYGVITLGIRYAAAIILPVVGIFFLCFAFLEDCGYLPRLAVVFDRFLHGIGLNGRAVIPLFLGLGCGTLAVMSTRTLECRRERILATFLLALSIPCSAQLGLVVALLSHKPELLVIWLSYILGIFFIAGWIGAILLPGRRSLFFMEIPPLRWPRLSNMLRKTGNRILWYFFEVLPVFISLSILLCVAKFFGWLNRLVQGLIPVMQVLGLPPETATAFLMGFIRRDYGTAGLYDLFLSGKMNDRQLVVSCIVFTLFLPCLAQFAVMIKERGLVASLAMTLIILTISFGSGCLLKILLT